MQRFFLFSLFLYLSSVLLSVGSTRSESRYSVPAARAAYLLGTVMTALVLVVEMIDSGHWVVQTVFEGILFSLVVLGMAYPFVDRKLKIPVTAGLFSVLSLFLGVLGLVRLNFDSGVNSSPVVLLASHTYCMFLALAAFSFSFLFATLFLIQDALIKRRMAGKFFLNLPSLELTSRLNLFSLTIGLSSYLVGLIGGIMIIIFQNADHTSDRIIQDPSIWLSLIMLVFYILLVTLRFTPLNRARTVSYTSLICYFLLLIVFFAAHTV